MQRIVAIALVGMGIVGCNSIVGIHQPLEDASAAPAPQGGFDTNRFVGTWQTSTGSAVVNCPNTAPTTVQDVGTLVVTKGESSDLVFANGNGACPLRANVTDANTATVLPGQTCVEPDNGTNFTYDFTSGTFVLKSDGTGEARLSGTVSAEGGGSCSFEQNDPYTKS